MKYFDIYTVLDLSLRATQNFEWSSRLRSDHGGEKVGCGMQWKKEERLIEGAFLFFKTESFIWLFVEESVAKGLIDGCVFDNLMQTFTADRWKSLSTFQFF